ncbi:MAG TPA: family 20 glycosylhydrolase [Pseudothermotoga sp.]|nr:family 20 glycosylhydrolase [Pseudothermotoga sp.]
MLPKPKKIINLEKEFNIPFRGKILVSGENLKIGQLLRNELEKSKRCFSLTGYGGEDVLVRLIVEPNCIQNSQGYRLKVTEKGITVVSKTIQGMFYGIQTLKQLMIEHNCKIPAMIIEDEPDFENRGFMLDISRNRIPSMNTLKKLIDTLSELKYNQLQLYMEHTFAYEKHETVWKTYTPLTADEILDLDSYCKERFIELVPNQNSFGHLGKWLKHEKYKYLAECPDGFETPWGEKYGPFSLSPAVPETLKFLDELYEELLPNFTSTKFNIGGDETYDLGLGRSKQMCNELGKGKVYLDFLLKVYKTVKKYGKTMMFWGDIIKNHAELVAHLPDDIIAMVWGYELDHPYDSECELFSSKGITFYVCPGTSTWDSFVGRSENALMNIENALVNGKKHAATGFLLTDWGDNGHPQHLPFSMIPLGYAATVGWNLSSANLCVDDLLKEIDLHVFKTNLSIAEQIYQLGLLYKSVNLRIHNMSPYFMALVLPHKMPEYLTRIDDNDLANTYLAMNRAREVIAELANTETPTDLNDVMAQIINNAEMLILGMQALIFLKEYGEIMKVTSDKWNSFEHDFEKTLENYKVIWLSSNRPGGLEESIEKLTKILRMRK